MSETREKTKKQLRRILSIAFSLDAAMDAFLADMVEEDGEGEKAVKDSRQEDECLMIAEMHDGVREMTYELHRLIVERYDKLEDEEDE